MVSSKLLLIFSLKIFFQISEFYQNIEIFRRILPNLYQSLVRTLLGFFLILLDCLPIFYGIFLNFFQTFPSLSRILFLNLLTKFDSRHQRSSEFPRQFFVLKFLNFCKKKSRNQVSRFPLFPTIETCWGVFGKI